MTRPRVGGGKRRALVEVHTSPLTASDVTEIGGLPVTSLARTTADLARTLSFERAIAAGDRALNLGLERNDLERVVAGCRGWPGVRQARRLVEFVDPRSESPGESVSRLRLAEALLPAPEPQFEVFDHNGVLVARCDFGWAERRTLGEFDGKVKYGRLLKPGQSVEEVLYQEKLREDALRDLGWQVVRWIWADLYRRGVIADRVRRAFARTTGLAA